MPALQWTFCLCAGALLTLSLEPFGWWPLALVSSAILFFCIEAGNVKQVFSRCLFYSLGLFGSGASWVYVSIHDFGYTSVALAASLTFLFCFFIALVNALAWLCYPLVIRGGRASGITRILAFAATGLLTEQLRSWLFTGFPWLYAGYSQTESLLAGWAPIAGVYGISFILYLSGAVLAGIYRLTWNQPGQANIRKSQYGFLILAALPWLAGPALKSIEWTTVAEKPLSASIIQANISQHDKWRPQMLGPSLDIYRQMSKNEWREGNLVLWPEAAIPLEYHRARAFLQQAGALATRNNASLVTGIPYREQSDAMPVFNSVVALGNGSGLYHKQRLVPYGEYVPLEAIASTILSIFELPLSSMSAGDADQAALRIGQWQSRPLICYEIVYPGLAAEAAQTSDALITVSNDSWFGASIGPLQHLQMAQMRALENGRYLLRATGNGVSAIVNHKGRLVAKSEQFEREVLRGQFFLASGTTPWSAAGYRLVHLLAPLLLALIYFYERYNSR